MLHDASPTAPSRGWLSRALARFAAPAMPPDAKASRTGPLIALEGLREPVWSPRDYAAFAREGMMQNAIVYRAVRMVAEAAASVPLLLYNGDMEIETHPLLDLLARPNPVSTRADLLEAWYGALLVSGNAYLEAVAVAGELRELHALRADRMQVIPGPDGWPEGYVYTANGESVRFIADVVEGVRPILHLKFFHPANDHYGLSPLEAAATAIDIHNTASRWNKALLDNSARPSGALVYTARDGNLSPDQFERLKSELEAGFQGAAHAGRPMLLEGGLDWKSMSLTPKDMDFIEAKHVAAREIALALGVPPMLLGIPGDNTYSNYQEATRTLWRQTVLPLVTRTAHALSAWLAPAWNENLALRPDLDAIDALSPERDALWSRLEKTTFLTPDEKRAAIGYAPLGTPGHKYRPDQARDDHGRWTDEGGGEDAGREITFTIGTGSRTPQSDSQEAGRADQNSEGADGEDVILVSRRRSGGYQVTPVQEMRLSLAVGRAREATRQVRELEPDWKGPTSLTDPYSIEGEIAKLEATAQAAEARLAEILKDAIPGSNPLWGVNRLTKELYDRGFVSVGPTKSAGRLYRNPETGEEVRIMERPSARAWNSPPEKYYFEHYYRYQVPGRAEGRHVPIPNKK